MPVIDFRVRPPYRGYLDTVMYTDAVRRDRFTRQLGFEPSPAATEKSVAMMIEEMDAADVDIGVVVGRNSGFFGSVDNRTVQEFVAAHPGRFVAVASIDAANRKAAIAEIDWAIAAGFKAVNIEPGAYAVPIYTDDRRLYPIYAHCEDRGVPVIVMNGGNAGPDLELFQARSARSRARRLPDAEGRGLARWLAVGERGPAHRLPPPEPLRLA